jgi:hypothetical protein
VRKILVTLGVLVLLIVALLALWIFRGREISSFVDRYWTVESQSAPIHSVAYQGNGTGGILVFNDIPLSLNKLKPGMSLSIGSTKDNQLALASNGTVFPFGPLTSDADAAGEQLATMPLPADQAFLATRHSVLSWPNPLDFNFITGRAPSWKRHIYYEVRWKKGSGAKLEMLWRYEQFFYPGNGWGSGFMTRESSTGLIRVKINE